MTSTTKPKAVLSDLSVTALEKHGDIPSAVQISRT